MTTGNDHPDLGVLIRYHLGRLDDEAHAAVDRHVAVCRACAARLEATRVTFDHGLSVDLKTAGAGKSPSSDDDLPFATEFEDEQTDDAK